MRYLTTPDGVVADMNEITPSQFLPISQALFAAKKNQPFVPRVELAVVDEQLRESLDSAQSILGATSTEPATLKAILSSIRLREDKDKVGDHIINITELTKSLEPNAAGQKLVTALNATTPDLSKKIDKALRTRLIMEMNLTECSGLYKPLANAARALSDSAQQALDASFRGTPEHNRAELMKDALNFLESLDDCPPFSAQLATQIDKSLSDIIASAGVMKAATITTDTAYQDAATAIETKMKAEKMAVGGALTHLRKGIRVLDLAKNPWLRQVLIPEAYDGPDLKPYYQFPTDLVEGAFVKNTAPLVLSLPSDAEVRVYEQFLALKGDTVRTLDLIKLSESAHALRLTAGQFIDWIHEILTKMAASGKNPWVFVRGIGALDYEPYSDAAARKHAMALNVERMLKNVAGVKLVVPVTKEHNFIFTESATALAARRVQVPLNLLVADAIVKGLITFMLPLPSTAPLMAMAKALRALDPESFFLSSLMGVLHDYEQEVTTRTPIDETHVALSIAAQHLAMKPNRIEESRALAYTPDAIEAMLLANPTTFSKASMPSVRSDHQMRSDISHLRLQMQSKADNADLEEVQISLKDTKESLGDEIKNRKNALDLLANEINTLKNNVDTNIDNLKNTFKNQQSTMDKELTLIKNELNLQKNTLADLGNTQHMDVQQLKNKNTELEKMINKLEKEINKKVDDFSFTNLKNDLNTKFTDTKNQLDTMAKKDDVKNLLKNIAKDTDNSIEKAKKELELSLKTDKENINKLKENIKNQRDEIDDLKIAQQKDSKEIREELNNTKNDLKMANNEIAKKAGKDELTKLGNEVQDKLKDLQDILSKKINEKLSSDDFDKKVNELKSSLEKSLAKTQDALSDRIDTLNNTVNDNEKKLSILENAHKTLDQFVKDMKNEIESELKNKLSNDVFLNDINIIDKQMKKITERADDIMLDSLIQEEETKDTFKLLNKHMEKVDKGIIGSQEEIKNIYDLLKKQNEKERLLASEIHTILKYIAKFAVFKNDTYSSIIADFVSDLKGQLEKI